MRGLGGRWWHIDFTVWGQILFYAMGDALGLMIYDWRLLIGRKQQKKYLTEHTEIIEKYMKEGGQVCRWLLLIWTPVKSLLIRQDLQDLQDFVLSFNLSRRKLEYQIASREGKWCGNVWGPGGRIRTLIGEGVLYFHLSRFYGKPVIVIFSSICSRTSAIATLCEGKTWSFSCLWCG